jgi:tRNA pseudouridine55 synthase
MIAVLKNKPEDFDSLQNGFLVLIDKPVDWTSFDVCKKIRNIVKVKKVGHAGTLDPFATGLLLIGVGKGTKLMSSFIDSSKRYEAQILFGKATDTFDITGKITNEMNDFDLGLEQIEDALKKFSGEIKQMPPMYSAKKIQGKALYKYARKGIEVDRKEQIVNIFEVYISKWQKPLLNIELHVSKGTYIRSYANDLGMELQVPAVLNKLKRTMINEYHLKDSFTIEQFATFWERVSKEEWRS